jgi:hypothetical protein
MYNLLNKYQDINGIWYYSLILFENQNIETITSNVELEEEELNNVIKKFLFESECNIDYSDFSKTLKETIQFYDKFGIPKEELRG